MVPVFGLNNIIKFDKSYERLVSSYYPLNAVVLS